MDRLVLFGASGDLTRKMLIPALYRLEERGALDQGIVGVALDPWDVGKFRSHVAEAVAAAITDVDQKVESSLLDRLDYLAGDYGDASTYQQLADLIGTGESCLDYLAIPPTMFETVASGLERVGLMDRARFLVEKPFGRDLDTARELNDLLHRFLTESQIYRIDHFLGKEPVENVLAFRYANPIFDSVWSKDHIDHIQITMAESFGVDGRGSLYESLGVIRDVVQNHLLQVVCLLTMEAPISPDADALADARVDVLKAVKTLEPRDLVCGQYEGYRETESVAELSTVPTYIALSLHIDRPRWLGVPIYIRAGKAMATTATEAIVVFRRSPPLSFSRDHSQPAPNELVFRIGPSDGVDLRVQTKTPGSGMELTTTPLTVDYATLFGRIPLAYEHVLYDALHGDRSQFAREDAVEEAWRIVDDIVDTETPPPNYRPGTWGPKGASDVLHGGRHWIDPT